MNNALTTAILFTGLLAGLTGCESGEAGKQKAAALQAADRDQKVPPPYTKPIPRSSGERMKLAK